MLVHEFQKPRFDNVAHFCQDFNFGTRVMWPEAGIPFSCRTAAKVFLEPEYVSPPKKNWLAPSSAVVISAEQLNTSKRKLWVRGFVKVSAPVMNPATNFRAVWCSTPSWFKKRVPSATSLPDCWKILLFLSLSLFLSHQGKNYIITIKSPLPHHKTTKAPLNHQKSPLKKILYKSPINHQKNNY